MDLPIQLDFSGNKIPELDICDTEETPRYTKYELENNFLEKYFIYKNRLILLDDSNKLVLKYKNDLFNELIEELNKLFNFLDVRCSCLKSIDNNGNDIIITKEEIETTIRLFEKLNSLK